MVSFRNVGRRPDVFSGMPWALYLSRNKDYEIKATSEWLEFAQCWVPTDQDYPTQLVTPADSEIELRGGGNASRQINGILAAGFQLSSHCGGRGVYAQRQLVELSAA